MQDLTETLTFDTNTETTIDQMIPTNDETKDSVLQQTSVDKSNETDDHNIKKDSDFLNTQNLDLKNNKRHSTESSTEASTNKQSKITDG